MFTAPPPHNSLFTKIPSNGPSVANPQSLFQKATFRGSSHYTPPSPSPVKETPVPKKPTPFAFTQENTYADETNEIRIETDSRFPSHRPTLPPRYLAILVFFLPFWVLLACNTATGRECSQALNGPSAVSTAACFALGVTTTFNAHSSLLRQDLELVPDKLRTGWVFVNASLLPKCSGQFLPAQLSSIMIMFSVAWGTATVAGALFAKGPYRKTLAVVVVSGNTLALVVGAGDAASHDIPGNPALAISLFLLAVGIVLQ